MLLNLFLNLGMGLRYMMNWGHKRGRMRHSWLVHIVSGMRPMNLLVGFGSKFTSDTLWVPSPLRAIDPMLGKILRNCSGNEIMETF